MPKMKRIGIIGGTFDPIHVGHLVIAEAVRMEYELDKVLFIPAANPPHKQDTEVTTAIHRYIMTVMATCSNPYFEVSTIEMERSGPSYTIDTIKALLEQYGDKTELYFIMGTDAMRDLPTWNDADSLLELCKFVAAIRPGCKEMLGDIIGQFGDKGRQQMHLLATPELEISSTDIRDRVKHGRSIKYMVPENVEAYIAKTGLYCD